MADLAFQSSLGRSWLRRRMRKTVNIVYYHWVGEHSPHYAGGCPLDRFWSDLKFLKQNFKIVSLQHLIDREEEHAGSPSLAVTFDDGFDLSHPDFLQILDENSVKATSLVVTACLDNAHLMWRNMLSVIQNNVQPSVYLEQYNKLMAEVGEPGIRDPRELMSASLDWDMSRKDEWATELWRRCGLPPVGHYLAEHRPYFTRDGVREWLRAGHSIGLHTRTHPLCSRLSWEEVEAEIVNPARELKREFGVEKLAFSYPFGDRLPVRFETDALHRGGLSCALGIRGFASRRTPPQKWERQGIEATGASWDIIGRAAVRGVLRSRSVSLMAELSQGKQRPHWY